MTTTHSQFHPSPSIASDQAAGQRETDNRLNNMLGEQQPRTRLDKLVELQQQVHVRVERSSFTSIVDHMTILKQKGLLFAH